MAGFPGRDIHLYFKGSYNLVLPLRKGKRGRRDGSEVKSTDCSSRGPKFKSQQSHGGSQPSVMRSDALFWPAGIHRCRTFVYIINN